MLQGARSSDLMYDYHHPICGIIDSFMRVTVKHSKVWSKNRDWFVMIILLIAVVIVLLAISYWISRPEPRPMTSEPTRTYQQYENDLYSTKQLDPKYPVTAKTQASYYRTYTVGDIYFDISRLNVNTSRDAALGSNEIVVSLHNSRNATVTPDNANQFTIGCINYDKPYRTTVVPVESLTFRAYEQKDVVLHLDVNCIYIGTADGAYFWQVY